MSSSSPEIAEMKDQIRKQQQEIVRLHNKIRRLQRGEYICKTCGLRKDSEPEVTHEF